MSKPIDFYFDFSSPYGYLASTQIEALAAKHNRAINWHPILLGAVFKVTGSQPLLSYPLKGDYAEHDFNRTAREKNIPYSMPDPFPVGTVALCRATYWAMEHDKSAVSSLAVPLIHAAYSAYYTNNRNIGEPETVMEIVKEVGLDADACAAACGTPEIKDRLRAANDTAIERGVFGSPMIFVDDEPFWGSDRLTQIDTWLERGGW